MWVKYGKGEFTLRNQGSFSPVNFSRTLFYTVAVKTFLNIEP